MLQRWNGVLVRPCGAKRLARLEGPGGAGGAEAEGGGTEYTEEQINDLQQAFDTCGMDLVIQSRIQLPIQLSI